MRYSFISSAVLAFVAAVHAAEPTADFDPMTVPTKNTDTVAAGSTYTIKWTSLPKYNGTVTLKLLEGASTTTLALAADPIDTDVDNSDNEYDWDIPTTVGSFAFYGIQISWDADPTIFQYSFPFHITGGGSSSSSSSSSAAGGSTKTIQVSTNPTYTPTSSSSSARITTSTSANSSTVATVTSSTTPTAAANSTLSTSGSLRPSSTGSSSRSSSATAPAAATSTGAAMANLAKGSFAVFGGAVLALAL